MRWGILWKPLGFSMKHNIQIIDACLRLHNFIVDFREDNRQRTALEELDKVVFEDDCRRFRAVNLDLENYGVFGGDDEPQIRGRPTNNESISRKAGFDIRSGITSEVKRNKYTRPKANWFRENNRFLNL